MILIHVTEVNVMYNFQFVQDTLILILLRLNNILAGYTREGFTL